MSLPALAPRYDDCSHLLSSASERRLLEQAAVGAHLLKHANPGH